MVRVGTNTQRVVNFVISSIELMGRLKILGRLLYAAILTFRKQITNLLVACKRCPDSVPYYTPYCGHGCCFNPVMSASVSIPGILFEVWVLMYFFEQN